MTLKSAIFGFYDAHPILQAFSRIPEAIILIILFPLGIYYCGYKIGFKNGKKRFMRNSVAEKPITPDRIPMKLVLPESDEDYVPDITVH